MVDLKKGSGEAASAGDAPDERIEADVECACRAAAVIDIIGAEANDRAEGLLPRKVRQGERNFRIGSKLSAGGSGRRLILIDEQGTNKADRVIAQAPAGGIVISRAGEGASAEDEQIAAVAEVVEDDGPGRFRHNGTLWKNEKAGLRVAELGSELIG